MKLWIARDKDMTISLFSDKPIKDINYWYNDADCDGSLGELPSDYFPEVTFENSPQEVELKLVK